jgi:hypothetical protein
MQWSALVYAYLKQFIAEFAWGGSEKKRKSLYLSGCSSGLCLSLPSRLGLAIVQTPCKIPSLFLSVKYSFLLGSSNPSFTVILQMYSYVELGAIKLIK